MAEEHVLGGVGDPFDLLQPQQPRFAFVGVKVAGEPLDHFVRVARLAKGGEDLAELGESLLRGGEELLNESIARAHR